MRRRLAIIALGAALSFQALAQGLFDDNEARRRVERLREQMDANQRTIEERLAKMEGDDVSRRAMVELSAQIESLRGEIAKMRGQIEVVTNQMDSADKRQKDLYLDIDTRLRKLEQAREQAAAQPPAPAPVPAPSGEAEASPAETRAYQAALDQFKLGN